MMAPSRLWRDDRAAERIMACCVLILTLCFIIGTPRNGGPDEPAHAVASAALVRGQRPLLLSADVHPDEVYSIPGWVGAPDPGCFALRPLESARCADTIDIDRTVQPAVSSAAWYPIWGHIAPGLASLVSWPQGYTYLARGLGAVVPVTLLVGSLLALRRRSSLVTVAALIGFTPIAWFTLGIINPSSQAITAGLALWVGLLGIDWRSTNHQTRVGWLTVGAFVALELTRRDGSLLATLLVLLVCLNSGVLPSRIWAAVSRPARLVVVVALLLQAVGKLESQAARADVLLAAAPLGLIVGELLGRAWLRARTRYRRRHLIAGGVIAGIGAFGCTAVLLDALRADGLRLATIREVVSTTGDHLRQLVGVLGWLDAPTPDAAVYVWWALIGMLTAIAVMFRPRGATTSMVALVSLIGMSWILALGVSSSVSGSWQGRYSLPIVVGIPLLLTTGIAVGPAQQRRLVAVLAAGMWFVINAAFMNTQRRWAVGLSGSWMPWDWNTWDAVLPPTALVVIHLATTAVLAVVCTTAPRAPRPARTRATTPRTPSTERC
jgi:hypothetical protein